MFGLFKKKKEATIAPKVIVRMFGGELNELSSLCAHHDLEFKDITVREIKLTEAASLEVDYENFEVLSLPEEMKELVDKHETVEIVYLPHVSHSQEAKVLFTKGEIPNLNTSMIVFKDMTDGVSAEVSKDYKYLPTKEIVFPLSVDNVPLRRILGPFSMGLEKLSIHKNIHTIGPGAFQVNEISELIIEDRDLYLTISAGAFKRNKLTKFKAHKTIKFIGANAFTENQLEFVDLGKTKMTLVKDAFRANNIKRIHIDKAEIEYSANFVGKQIPEWTEGTVKATRKQFPLLNDKVMHLDGQPTGWLALLPQI